MNTAAWNTACACGLAGGRNRRSPSHLMLPLVGSRMAAATLARLSDRLRASAILWRGLRGDVLRCDGGDGAWRAEAGAEKLARASSESTGRVGRLTLTAAINIGGDGAFSCSESCSSVTSCTVDPIGSAQTGHQGLLLARRSSEHLEQQLAWPQLKSTWRGSTMQTRQHGLRRSLRKRFGSKPR